MSISDWAMEEKRLAAFRTTFRSDARSREFVHTEVQPDYVCRKRFSRKMGQASKAEFSTIRAGVEETCLTLTAEVNVRGMPVFLCDTKTGMVGDGLGVIVLPPSPFEQTGRSFDAF